MKHFTQIGDASYSGEFASDGKGNHRSHVTGRNMSSSAVDTRSNAVVAHCRPRFHCKKELCKRRFTRSSKGNTPLERKIYIHRLTFRKKYYMIFLDFSVNKNLFGTFYDIQAF